MVEQNDSGWFVMNVKDAPWRSNPAFGMSSNFEAEGRFEGTGVRIFVLPPGKPLCRYHRESAQEDFLVIAGRCKLIVNGEERRLETWDFVHFPPGATHVFVGDDEVSCALVGIGDRPEQHDLFYPKEPLAAKYGAEAPEETADPRVAYGDVPPTVECDAPDWPFGKD